MGNLTPEEKLELVRLLETKQRFKDETKLDRYSPYAKQRDFHAAGAIEGVRERLLMAGNQLGKTYSAAYEAAMHLTGKYPAWWAGKRFANPTVGWAASLTSQGTRDTVQRLLLGQPTEWGTGSIPKASIIDIKRSAHGVADSVESIMVRHELSGGVSRITLKTYDQGRERWQGETLDFVWLDEEPPIELYTEALTRTNATKGIVWMTFTPLLGMSGVVSRFLVEEMPGTHVTTMTIEDAEHYTPEQRAAIIASYPEHERKARSMGIPTLGSGAVFPIEEARLKAKAYPIPDAWSRICGIDFGWEHPTAAAWLAWDRDADKVVLYDAYRVKQALVPIHSSAIKARGSWIPVAWPHDGNNDTAVGPQLAKQYRDEQVNMLHEHAQFSEDWATKTQQSKVSVEAGISEMLTRMETGRFEVFEHLNDWWEEFRLYHRKDGKIVKERDDLISATRYAVMMLRYAITKPNAASTITRTRSSLLVR